MTEQLIWFSLAVLPLIVVPGPDMLLCIAQGLTRGYTGLWRAVNGITLGYLAHAVLAAIGVATIVATSPVLFETLRWLGIAYLAWIALNMLKTALFASHTLVTVPTATPISLWRGFLTSFLNPKVLFVYLSIIPQFIDPASTIHVHVQAFALSITNALLGYITYAVVGLVAVRFARSGSVSTLRTRILEGIGGTLVGGIAIRLGLE